MVEIRQIIDEERRVVFEGYIFAAEIKELRSGRSLLEIKVTDYTDSILVKMFSRKDDDAENNGPLEKRNVGESTRFCTK